MEKPKTHFDQVPVQIAKKILEKQVQQQKAAEKITETKIEKLEADVFAANAVNG